MKNTVFDYFLLVGFFALIVLLGYIAFEIIKDEGKGGYTLKGYWSHNSSDEFICINIRDMTMEEALRTCKHEVGHELFAEVCERDWGACQRVIDEEISKKEVKDG